MALNKPIRRIAIVGTGVIDATDGKILDLNCLGAVHPRARRAPTLGPGDLVGIQNLRRSAGGAHPTHLSMSALLEAKRLVNQLGSVEDARRALDALSKLL